MRIIAIVQARMGSSRLPGKSLLALKGRPMLEHVLRRVRAMQTIDHVLLATTWDERDAALIALAAGLGIPAWRGSLQDVLLRYCEAAGHTSAEVIVRVTGDCPLFCPDVGDTVVRRYLADGRPDIYAWNDTAHSGYPDGTDVEVFGRDLLERAHAITRSGDTEREHVTAPIRALAADILTERLDHGYPQLKLSVDRPICFERIKLVMGHLPMDAMTWPALEQACRDAGLIQGAST